MRIYLVGFMAVGKTTIGQCLAEQIGCDFVDTDQIIESNEGKKINQIFEDDGEEYFRELEIRLIKHLSKQKDVVISTGGGLPCFGSNMALMNAKGKTVHVRMPWKKWEKAIKKNKLSRPLLQSIPAMRKLYRERYSYYSDSQYQVINAGDPNATCRRILDKIHD